MKVGIAGTGKMGLAIGERLLAQGDEVFAWNRTREKAKPLIDAGARLCATPKELVDAVDVVITILMDADAIDATYRGTDGLLSGDVAGKLFIEMSTVVPDTEKKLASDIQSKGGAMVEAPVGGSVGPAKEGKLIGLVGGDQKNVDRAMPVLRKLCRRVEHVGPIGAGASFKLGINLPLHVYWHALGEAFALCRHHGVDPALMTELFSDTSGGTNVMRIRHGAVASALKGEKVVGTVDIDSLRKDLRAMLEEARNLGVDLPVTAQTLACYDQSANAGLGSLDPSNDTAYWANQAARRH
jgi:3-hydroxyisobutyrate dehydrogenase